MAPDTISRASIKTGPNAELVQFNDVRLGCIGIWGAKIGGKRAMSVCHHSPHLTRHHIYVPVVARICGMYFFQKAHCRNLGPRPISLAFVANCK